ncbi:MAG: hypothetical protein L0I24_01090 [Pseudonocardia sp.]|nr:hypothetical protein [Pseudonocardia sp.]
MTAPAGGPWTRHGHDIPGVTVTGGRPPAVARCGGPALCKQCARVAELEAGEMRTEWGLRWPEPDGKVRFTGSEEQVKSPHTMHWREGGAEIVQREIREHVGQWTAAS